MAWMNTDHVYVIMAFLILISIAGTQHEKSTRQPMADKGGTDSDKESICSGEKCLSHQQNSSGPANRYQEMTASDLYLLLNSSISNMSSQATFTDPYYLELLTIASVLMSKVNKEEPVLGELLSSYARQMMAELAAKLSTQMHLPMLQFKEAVTRVEIATPDLVFSVRNVYEMKNFEEYIFPKDKNLSKLSTDYELRVTKNIFKFAETKKGNPYFDPARIVSLLYAVDTSRMNAVDRDYTINENIISTTIYPKIVQELDEENRINISFKLPKYASSNASLEHVCVYWDTQGGNWSTHGCRVEQVNATHVSCSCNHLTEFSTLMRVKKISFSKADRIAMNWISMIGCGVSAFFLVLTITLMMSFRKLRRQNRYRTHINLCTALLVSNTLILLSEEFKYGQYVCWTMALLLYYFYLSAFCWMLCEGIILWRALVCVFNENDKFWWYIALGWGSPLVLTALSGGIGRRGLIDFEHCWLSSKNYSIWAFNGPALFVILVNFVVLVTILLISLKHALKADLNRIKTMSRMTLILLPLLGTTWVFGVLVISEETVVVQYIFTLLNSFQGFFIFLFYAAFSKEVREEISNLRKTYLGRPKSESIATSRSSIASSTTLKM